jgi:acyl transferase domain-containing protein
MLGAWPKASKVSAASKLMAHRRLRRDGRRRAARPAVLYERPPAAIKTSCSRWWLAEVLVVGGAKSPSRRWFATGRAARVMAREVSVDVASHSPQVDRSRRYWRCPGGSRPGRAVRRLLLGHPVRPARHRRLRRGYGVTTCATRAVRRGRAGRMEDGYRVFAELSPHTLMTNAVDQTADSLDITLAALATLVANRSAVRPARVLARPEQRRRQGGHYGAVPDGNLSRRAAADLDAPRADPGPRSARAGPRCPIAVHPLLGAHVRLTEEPERHAWQARRRHRPSRGWPFTRCRRGLAARRRVCADGAGRRGRRLGAAAEVHDVSFDQLLLLGRAPISRPPRPSPGRRGRLRVDTYTRRADQAGVGVAAAARGGRRPRAVDIVAVLGRAHRRVDGAEMRAWYAQRGITTARPSPGWSRQRQRRSDPSTTRWSPRSRCPVRSGPRQVPTE